MMENWECSFK